GAAGEWRPDVDHAGVPGLAGRDEYRCPGRRGGQESVPDSGRWLGPGEGAAGRHSGRGRGPGGGDHSAGPGGGAPGRGVRPGAGGEVIGLRRADVALAGRTVAVRGSGVKLLENTRAAFDAEPKTDAGKRSVVIPPHVLPVLAEHMALWAGPDRVFVGRDGRPM